MLIHPWDAAETAEWQAWLAEGHDFGQLVAVDNDDRPVIVPVHFQFDGTTTIRVHLARANPLWRVWETRPEATLSVVDDYAFIPGSWRAPEGQPPEHGVPTSYYASVQLCCAVTIVDDPEALAELLREQLGHFQPEGGHAPVEPGEPPYGRLLSGIRGAELRVREARAKFKYGDRAGDAEQLPVARRLRERGDLGAARQVLRRNGRRTRPLHQ